jgi:hypothetical protein
MAHKITLKPGTTVHDLLDTIEAETTKYMATTRGLTEQDFRKLLNKDPEVQASYNRKNTRAKQALIAAGLSAKVFA